MEKGPALPKNIRQIGEISGRERVCIEDYVMTWIRKRGQQEDKGYLGVFFGEQQETEDLTYVFIRGVFEIPAEIQEPQQREAIRQEYEKFFGDWAVQGLCVIGAYPMERMKTLGAWIPESGKLIYHLQDQEETLYRTEEEQYRRLRGYFVFYEQNKRMQEYLMELFRDDSVEKESVPDRAIRSFREKIKEKGEQKHSSFLRMASSFFVITILIIGAIVVNRMEDIRMLRGLSAGEASPVYQPQAEVENDQNGVETDDETSGQNAQGTTELSEGAKAQSDTAVDKEKAQNAAAMSAAQYNAVQKAAEEAALAGPDTFWESSDLEDNTETPASESQEAVAENPASASVQDSADNPASASVQDGADNPVSASAQNTVENSASVPAQDVTENSSSDLTQSVTETPAPDADGAQDAKEAVAVRHTQAGYVIKEGDTLAKICSRYYGSTDRIAEICEVNGIEDANVILPGQRIVLP